MAHKLYTTESNFRAFKTLIAAEYNSVNVEAVTVDASDSSIAALSPTGKLPVLATPKGNIFESNAMARYVAGMRRDTELMGTSFFESAQVDSWVDFTAHEVEVPMSLWVYPVLGYMPFNLEIYTKAKADFGNALKTLNDYLTTRTYLVGEKITLADIVVISALVYPMKLVADKAFLKPYGNVVRYFNTCVNQPEFKAVIGDVKMCAAENHAEGSPVKNAAPAAAKKGEKKKKEAKKDAAPAADAPAPAAPKVEHPYKIMDKEAKSPFNMDAWKKTYSNCKTYEAAMANFWENFDAQGWSLWHQCYNFNEENKRAFMTSNAVGGFQQRTDEIRKWAFGIMDVLGSEETSLEIKGVWLLRGQTVDHLKNANDDANWYTWKLLAGEGTPINDEAKKIVAEYWCSEENLEGKPIVDSKVFK